MFRLAGGLNALPLEAPSARLAAISRDTSDFVQTCCDIAHAVARQKD